MLKACVGVETRVFVPEFSDKEINSPGEPGISYHMGVGFPKGKLQGQTKDFLQGLKKIAQQRNQAMMKRVNKFLAPVKLDYKKDVLPLTPSGNPTERHLCLAYAGKAQSVFDNADKLKNFWAEKLSTSPEQFDLPEGTELLNLIRAKTMKQGGTGYVKPDKGDFPTMAEMNRFVLAAGGIATHTWLNGASAGEQEIEKLLEVAMRSGVAALNIIPDRNYTAAVKDQRLANLYKVVELAEKLNLVVVVGTEMNSPGQKFVDDFSSEELRPLMPTFLKGAHIVYAHSVLQQAGGLGYTSEWAKKAFAGASEKNAFFEKLGAVIHPSQAECLSKASADMTPKQIFRYIANLRKID